MLEQFGLADLHSCEDQVEDAAQSPFFQFSQVASPADDVRKLAQYLVCEIEILLARLIESARRNGDARARIAHCELKQGGFGKGARIGDRGKRG